MNGKKIFSVVAVFMIAMLALGSIPANAAASWVKDVTHPEPGWTPIEIFNNTTDGVWDGANTVTGTTTTGQFDIKYQQWLEGSHFEYADKVVGEDGYWGDCDPGWEVDLDDITQCRRPIPDHYVYADKVVDEEGHYGDCDPGWEEFGETQCRKPIPGHYIYADKVVDVEGHYGDCPINWEEFGETQCRIWVEDGYWDEECTFECPMNLVFTASRDYCPVEDSAYTHWDYWNYDCKRKIGWFWYGADKIHEDFSVTFNYDKWDHDTKCHRPTAESLGIPSWARCEFNRQFKEWEDGCNVCVPIWIDTSHYEYMDRPWIPTTYKCPDGYVEGLDPDDPTACAMWVDISYDYADREWIPETYVCPEGFTEGANPARPNDCAKLVDDSHMIYDTITYYVQIPGGVSSPCATCGSWVDEKQTNPGDIVLSRYADCDNLPWCMNPWGMYTLYTDEETSIMRLGVEIKLNESIDVLGKKWYLNTIPALLLGTYNEENPTAGGFYLVRNGKVMTKDVVRFYNGACACSNYMHLTSVVDGKYVMQVEGCYKNSWETAKFIQDIYYPTVMGKDITWDEALELVNGFWTKGKLPVTIELPKP